MEIVVEARHVDLLQLAALGEDDALHLIQVGEGVPADGGDLRADFDGLDGIPIRDPGRYQLALIVLHRAAAADHQLPAVVQRPGGVLSAGTGGHYGNVGRSDQDAIRAKLIGSLVQQAVGLFHIASAGGHYPVLAGVIDLVVDPDRTGKIRLAHHIVDHLALRRRELPVQHGSIAAELIVARFHNVMGRILVHIASAGGHRVGAAEVIVLSVLLP